MKQKFVPVLALLAAVALTVSGCAPQSSDASGTTGEASPLSSIQIMDFSDMFTDRDREIGYDESTAVAITLSGDSADCASSSVAIDGSTVTISREGTYVLSGTLDDGMILVDAADTAKIQLVLDGVSIHSETSAPIYIREADKVFLTTAPNSVNTLSSGGSYTPIDDNNIDAAIFAKSDLTMNGSGSLTIAAPAGHGVVSKDDLVVTSGTYVITAASHGLSGKDSVRIAGGDFTIESGKDGIQGENDEDATLGFVYIAGGDFAITAQGDGISAGAWLEIDGGTFSLTCGGGSVNGEDHTDSFGGMGGFGGRGGGFDPADMELPEDFDPDTMPGREPPEGFEPGSAPTGEPPEGFDPGSASTGDTSADTDAVDTVSTKGVKAAEQLVITDGTFTVDSADDAFHSNGSLTVGSGTYQIATGDDAFHADGALTILGGSISVTESYEGLEGLTVTVSGGEISIVSSDDGMNAAGGTDQSGIGGRQDAFAVDSDAAITITGGTISIDAGGDGIDSNGSLTVSGGTVYVAGPTGGADSAIDYNGEAAVTGGVVVATGTSAMAQNFGDASTQGSILLSVDSQEAGSTVSIADSSGSVLLSWTAGKAFDCVVISCPELTQGETYTVTAGTSETTLTLDTLIYGTGGMGGGFGGGMGGRPSGGRQNGGAPAGAEQPAEGTA